MKDQDLSEEATNIVTTLCLSNACCYASRLNQDGNGCQAVRSNTDIVQDLGPDGTGCFIAAKESDPLSLNTPVHQKGLQPGIMTHQGFEPLDGPLVSRRAHIAACRNEQGGKVVFRYSNIK